MCRKVNEIHKIAPPYSTQSNITYYSGFKYKGEYYSNGWVVLSKEGMKKFGTNFHRAKLDKHFVLSDSSKVYSFICYRKRVCKGGMNKLEWGHFRIYNEDVDPYIEKIEPIEDVSIDEILKLPHEDCMNALQLKSIKEGTYEPETSIRPLYKDWMLPEVMFGWVLYFIAFFAVEIFNGWCIQWFLRIGLFVLFNIWRYKQVYGMK